MKPEQFENKIESDRSMDCTLRLLIASAGIMAEGSVDPLEKTAQAITIIKSMIRKIKEDR